MSQSQSCVFCLCFPHFLWGKKSLFFFSFLFEVISIMEKKNLNQNEAFQLDWKSFFLKLLRTPIGLYCLLLTEN